MRAFAALVAAGLGSVVVRGQVSTAENSYSLDLCGCEDCCDVVEFDRQSTSFFSYTEAVPEDEISVYGTGFDYIVAETVPNVLTHYHLYPIGAPANLTCEASRAVVSDFDSWRVAISMQTSEDGSTCVVDWNGIFTSTAEYASKSPLVVYFLLKDIGSAPGDVLRFYVERDVANPIITIDELEASPYEVTTFATRASPGADEFITVVNLTRSSFAGLSCAYPASIRLTIGTECTRRISGSAYGQDQQTYVLASSQDDLDRCASSVTTEDNQIVYHMDMSIDMNVDSRCEAQGPAVPDSQRTLSFQLRTTDSVSSGNAGSDGGDGSSGIASQLQMRVASYSTIPCDGRVAPMARLSIVVRYDAPEEVPAEMRNFYEDEARLDDMALVRDASLSVCATSLSTPGGAFTCYETYRTQECLPMTNEVETRDNEQVNVCSFDRLGYLDLAATYTYADRTTDSATLDVPVLAAKEFTGYDCAVPADREDVTTSFPTSLTVDGASLDDEIVLSIAFDRLDNNAQVTLKIFSVSVSMQNGALAHTFTVDDKLALMSIPTTKYYSDAHFCRYEPEDGQCRPFYEQGTARWNDFCESNSASFTRPNRGYRACQRNTARSSDVFAFTPSNWIFGEFEGVVATLDITIVATIDDCATDPSARRRLGDGGDSDGSTVQTVGVSTSVALKGRAPASPADASGEGLGSTKVAVLATGVVCAAIAGAAFLWTRRRPAHRPAVIAKPTNGPAKASPELAVV